MSMGRRGKSQQHDLWVASGELPRSPSHAFYDRLNALLADAVVGKPMGLQVALCAAFRVFCWLYGLLMACQGSRGSHRDRSPLPAPV